MLLSAFKHSSRFPSFTVPLSTCLPFFISSLPLDRFPRPMQLYAAVLVARNFKIQEPLFVENFLFYDPVKDGQKRFRDKGAKSLLLWVFSHKTVLIYPWMRNPCEFTNAYRSCLVILLQRRQLNINMSFRGQIFNAQYCAYCFFLLIFSHTHCIYSVFHQIQYFLEYLRSSKSRKNLT